MMMPYTRIFQWYKLLFSIALVTVLNFAANAQDPAINYDESKMPSYTLPDPLRQSDGKRITRQEQWMKYQRPALLQLFADNVYGKMPANSKELHFAVRNTDSFALDGKAIRKQLAIFFFTGICRTLNGGIALFTKICKKTCSHFYRSEFLWQSYYQ